MIMDTNEALAVADKAADRNTPYNEAPSIMNMIYALEILADGYRQYVSISARRNNEIRDMNEELDRTQTHWSDLMESVRSALGQPNTKFEDIPQQIRLLVAENKAVTLENDQVREKWGEYEANLIELVRFLRDGLGWMPAPDVELARGAGDKLYRALGGVFADARLWARVKELTSGNFRAGDVVTADALNAFSEAVKDGAAATPHTTRIVNGAVWTAPYGTDPADWDKWTRVGMARDFTIEMTVDRPKLDALMGPDTAAVFAHPAHQHFPIGAPEPPARVNRVTRPQHSPAGAVFVRVGVLSDGKSVWRREGDDSALLLRWPEIVRYQAAVEA